MHILSYFYFQGIFLAHFWAKRLHKQWATIKPNKKADINHQKLQRRRIEYLKCFVIIYLKEISQ